MTDETVLATAAPATEAPAAEATPAAETTILAEATPDTTPAEGVPAAEVAAGAPEEYEAFLVPDESGVSEDFISAVTARAKEMNLSQDDAQKFVDFQFELQTAQETAADHQFKTVVTEWRAAAVADPEIGGAKWKDTVTAAGRYLAKYGTPELTKLFQETGIGNHPEVIRSYARGGKAIAEDAIHSGSTAATAPTTRAERMFGASQSKPA